MWRRQRGIGLLHIVHQVLDVLSAQQLIDVLPDDLRQMGGSDEEAAEEMRQPENVASLLQVDPIELEFGYGIIPLADVNQGGDLLDVCP